MKQLIPAVLIATACTGAGADDASLVERTDSAGIEIVRNLAPERPLEWRFERMFSLGGVDEGPQAFARLGAESIATDSAGRIYIADGANFVVRVFEENGTEIREMGGKGGGPGEFEFMGGFAVAPDGTVRVADFSKNGLVAFDAQGGTLPLVTTPGFAGSRLRFVGDAFALVITPPGAFESDSIRPHLLVGTASDTTRIAAEPSRPEGEFKPLPNCPIGLRIPPLLAPSLEWDARAGRLAVSDGTDYSIDVWAPDAAGSWRLERRVSRALDPITATVDIAAAEYPDSFRIRSETTRCAIGPREIAEALGYADVAPHVKDLALGPDGTLWIRHRTGDADVTRTDVFGADGTYLGTLPTDAPLPVAFRGRDQIVTLEKDDFDRPIVVIWRIVRG